MTSFTRAERISLKLHPTLNEQWVQSLIAADPAILGLGDLAVRDKERIQPRAGRLDLLLQDVQAKRRYEVEIQLGPTDETHIIRTIEYWDIERKRYPQYEHCAVLVAEDITSRFLNVVALFNGTIPLIALQMHALKVGEHMTLISAASGRRCRRTCLRRARCMTIWHCGTGMAPWNASIMRSTLQCA